MLSDLINKLKYRESQRRLSQDELEYAYLNKISYQIPEQRGDFRDYKYIKFLSDVNYAIFKNNNTIYFVIKGTNNKENLMTDVYLYINMLDKTFVRNEEKLLQIKKTYPRHTIKISGHSLGGISSLMLAKKYKLSGVVFNSYIPRVTTKFIECINETPLVVKFVNRDDILSNNGIYINNKKCVIMVNKYGQRSLLQNHTINCYLEDCFKY